MGHRSGSPRTAIRGCRTLICVGGRAAARAAVGLLLVLAGAAPPAAAATLGKASTSRVDRAQAIRQIPFERLTAEARQRIQAVVHKPSMYRRMPTNVINCDPQIYRFLVRYPEVVVNIWQLMGITKVSVDREGPYLLNAKDGVGTVTNIELVYGDQDTHLMYCEGHYDGPLFGRPLTGRCVLVLKSDYNNMADQHWQITNHMDVFLQIDNVAVDALTKTLHPLVGKSADLNFVQSTQFLERISQTSAENGPGMRRLAARLNNVQPEIREEFAELTQAVYETARSQRTEKVAQHTPASEEDAPRNE
jgi:hypothetical protein